MTSNVGVDGAALTDLERARRGRRFETVDVFERLYQAYLAVAGAGAVIAIGASLVGDAEVGAGTAHRVITEGPTWVGLFLAAALVAGLRSGLRGGPLALEAPFVTHVLLSPVPRQLALRRPAWAQLRQAAVGGAAAGGVVALIVAGRLPFALPAMVTFAAATGALVAITSTGLAMVVSGRRPPALVVHVGCLLLLGASVADLVAGTAWSPGSIAGRLALGGGRFDAVGLATVPAAALAALAGRRAIGGMSIEAARRRAGLVSELRMAVTRQDLRTVVLLQRRLAQDRARSRPWLRRGLRSLARLPALRLARPLVLCGVASAAAVAAWRGTTPLIVVAGLALWAAALDLIEPLAQEVDHPDRWASYPVDRGQLLTHHLVAPGLGLLVITLVPVSLIGLLGGATALAAAVVVPLAVAAAVVGAACSTATAPFNFSSPVAFVPEAMGTQLIFRVAWPPAIAVVACLPLLAGRSQLGAAAIASAELATVLPITFVIAMANIWLARRRPATF
ncbi:MAG: hypothetical protein JF603_09335 [Acidobacteria bacterium]|nr:hypothetical protein [Acidobacteriota bacterium]